MKQVYEQLIEICASTPAKSDADSESTINQVSSKSLNTASGTSRGEQLLSRYRLEQKGIACDFCNRSFSI